MVVPSLPGAPASSLAHVQAALPHLRRHAYMIAGNRRQADEDVCACLRAYRRTPALIRHRHAHLDLFRLFHRVAHGPATPDSQDTAPRTAALHTGDAPVAAGAAPSPLARLPSPLARLNVLTAPQRHILTLVSVEGFSVAQAALILDMEIDRAATLLTAARRRLMSSAALHPSLPLPLPLRTTRPDHWRTGPPSSS